MSLCEFKTIDGRLACATCKRPLPKRIKTPPMRTCMAQPAAPLTHNDLETHGPCRYLGLVLRTVGCQLCGQKTKHVAIHACQHPEKQGDEVSQDRHSVAQVRTDICRTCKLYPNAISSSSATPASPSTFSGTSADPPVRDGSAAE